MKEIFNYYNMLTVGVSSAALENRMWSWLARLLVPAIVAMGVAGALIAGLNMLIFYLFGIMLAMLMVYPTIVSYLLTCGAPAAANLVPIGYKRRTAYFFIVCTVASFVYAVAVMAALVAFFSLVTLALGVGEAFGPVVEPDIVHPAVYLMLAGLALGELGWGVLFGYKTSTKSFWLRFAGYLLLSVSTIVTLLFAPAMEGAPADVNVEVEALAKIFDHLNNPWLFAGIYFGVYALIFVAGVMYMLKKSRPSAL